MNDSLQWLLTWQVRWPLKDSSAIITMLRGIRTNGSVGIMLMLNRSGILLHIWIMQGVLFLNVLSLAWMLMLKILISTQSLCAEVSCWLPLQEQSGVTPEDSTSCQRSAVYLPDTPSRRVSPTAALGCARTLAHMWEVMSSCTILHRVSWTICKNSFMSYHSTPLISFACCGECEFLVTDGSCRKH